MSDLLQPAQFMGPKDKHGNSLYPQSKPDYDSTTQQRVSSRDEVQALLRKKTAHRYDADNDRYVRTPIHEWHLQGDQRSTLKIPAGYEIPEGYDPLR